MYVSDSCWVCAHTSIVVDDIRSRFPGLTVEVVNVDCERWNDIPESVFSVPTYTLNGRTVSLGNPSGEFWRTLDAFLRIDERADD